MYEATDWLLREYESGRRDFSNVSLASLRLNGVTLDDCVFREADFHGASFEGATFHNCDFEGTELWQTWIARSEFTRCRFDYASLVGAFVPNAAITECSFFRTTIVGAELGELDARDCDFARSQLQFSVIHEVKFVDCCFDFANLDSARLISTTLDDICSSVGVTCVGSTIDWASISLSIRAPRLREFLILSGMPDSFIVYMMDCARSQDPQGLFRLMRSTFISYGGPDGEFAAMVQEALQRAGVRTFFFVKDAVPGRKLHSVMRDGVTRYDRILLICSENSLDRAGVLNEIEQTLAREARDGGESYLIPITIDDYVFRWNPSRPELAQEVRSRVVADFRGAKGDPTAFAIAMQGLLLALRADSPTY